MTTISGLRTPATCERLAALVAVLAFVAGCATERTGPDEASAQRIWPPAPAAPRVEYVTQFSSAADLGIEVGLLGRLRGLFTGRGEREMVRPMAIVATADPVYFVADPGRKGVHRFDTARDRYALIVAEGGIPLPSPVGLALAGDGAVYVADSYLGRLYVIAPGADEAVPLTLADPPAQPTGIAIDPETRTLYVVDTANHRVSVYDRDGRLLRHIGERGGGDGAFNFPTMIWRTPEGELLVTDSMNFRVNAFDSGGRFLYTLGSHGDGSGDLSRPKGVATDSRGHIYLTDALFHVFQIFDNSGNFLLTVGTNGRGPGEFLLPTGIYISGDDMVYVCDSQNHRVQVFRYIGD